jgi:hypothetical protein
VKVASTVLRRGGGSNLSSLFDYAEYFLHCFTMKAFRGRRFSNYLLIFAGFSGNKSPGEQIHIIRFHPDRISQIFVSQRLDIYLSRVLKSFKLD